MEERNPSGGKLLLGVVIFVWGANFAVTKAAFRDFDPVLFAALRFTFGGALILFFTAWKEGNLRVAGKDLGAMALLGGLGVGVYQILWSTGLRLTSTTNSALILSAQPLLGALYLGLVKKEPVGPRTYAGMLLAFAGVLLIILKPGARFHFSPETLRGDVLTLVASLCFTIGITIGSRPLLERYSPLKFTGWTMMAGAVVLSVAAYPSALETRWAAVSPASWLALGYAVVFGAVVGHVFWFAAVARIGVTRCLTSHYLIPVWATTVSVLLLGERVYLQQILGGALILWGVSRVLRRRG
jgi:drug/metabolite transporter (DMT)-like permease